MSRLRVLLLSTLSAVTLSAIAACGDGSSTTPSGSSGVTLLLTDAPGDFRKAVVTISSIYLQAGDSESAPRVVLRDTPVTTDLLTLANSTAELVKNATVPAGSYAQLRFVITGGYVEVENANGGTSVYASSPTYAGLPAGTTVAGALQMPSLAQSGLKVNLPGGALRVDDDTRIVLVDFDVARSFGRAAGNSGQWVMQPVLTATELTTSATAKVTLARADTVTLPLINSSRVTLGQFKAVLSTTDGSREEIALTDANADGVFEGEFRYVIPGAYQLDLKAPSDSVQFTTRPTRPVALTLPSGGTATTAFVITSARK